MKTITKNLSIKEILKEKEQENKISKIVFAAILALLCLFNATNTKAQKYNRKFLNNLDANGVILDGYDPVAFFTDNKPVKGDASFQYKYNDAAYYFASQEHLDLFKENPEKYKPQFGAWCAYAVSLGRTAPIDVSTFSIVNDRLVLQHNQRAVNGWNKDVQGNLALADKYWPLVTTNRGKQIRTEADNKILLVILNAIAGLFLFIYFISKKAKKAKRVAAFKARQPVILRRNYSNEIEVS